MQSLIGRYIRPFDLTGPPLLRVVCIQRDHDRSILILDFHHIMADGESNAVLVRECLTLYQGGELSPLVLQYSDFSQWQNRRMQTGELKPQENYWLQRFNHNIPVVNIPTDFHREEVYNDKGSQIRRSLGKDLVPAAEALVRETETTDFMFFLAVYSILLSRYSRQEDIIIGTAVSGRTHADLESIIGMFVNMLPLWNRVESTLTFLEFLTTVKQNVLDAFDNQDYQFEELVDRLGLQRIPGRHLLFDFTFTFEKRGTHSINPANTNQPQESAEILYEHQSAKYDLLLKVTQDFGHLNLLATYKPGLFKSTTIELLLEHYREILEQVLKNPGIKLQDICLSHGLMATQSQLLQEEDDEFGF